LALFPSHGRVAPDCARVPRSGSRLRLINASRLELSTKLRENGVQSAIHMERRRKAHQVRDLASGESVHEAQAEQKLVPRFESHQHFLQRLPKLGKPYGAAVIGGFHGRHQIDVRYIGDQVREAAPGLESFLARLRLRASISAVPGTPMVKHESS